VTSSAAGSVPAHRHDDDGPADDGAWTDRSVIVFERGLAGFPDLRRFVLVELEPSGVLQALTSLDTPPLRFLVLPPAAFFPGYAPVVDDLTAEELGLSGPDDAQVLLIVTTGATPREATVNLRAPVVLNVVSRRAAQVVLDDGELSLRTPLVPADPDAARG
jgi:flagellar assembly factor FliW